MAHRLGQASWNTQLEDWTTLCGWHSARRNTKMSMAVRKPLTIATMANKWSPDPVQMANQTDPELKVNGPSDFANASEAPFGFGGWEGSHPQSPPCSVLLHFFACILCLSYVLSPFCGQKGLQPRRRYFVRQRDALENHNWIARAGFSHHARLPVCNRRLGVASAPAPCGLVPALRARRCLTSQKSWPAYFKPWRGRPVPNVARPRTCYNYIERLCSLTSVHIPCGHVGKNMG